MAVIYKATNTITGQAYIGFDSNWPMRRYMHKSDALLCKGHYFHNAIRKYGWDNFIWEILFEHEDDHYVLTVKEPEYILEHNTFWKNGGYNLTHGGDGIVGHKHTDEAKLKMSRAHSGKQISKESREKLSNSNKGKKRSDATKEKIRIARLGTIGSNDTKLKMSLAHKGKTVSTETRKKMSAWQIGRKFSQETIEKMRQKALLRNK